jgi:predicted kinase
LSIDELMLSFFGPHMPRADFDARLELCKAFLLDQAERLARLNVNVVLDWGFWTQAERRDVRRRSAAWGVECRTLYLAVPEVVLLERLKARNAALPAGDFEITEEMFYAFAPAFEPPQVDEEGVLVVDATRPLLWAQLMKRGRS